ncbi:MAG: helix-turn-helix domain-containing protein [Bacillota bacterium]
MSKNKISPIGESWDVFEKNIFTPEEIAASDLRVALVGEIVNARQLQGLTQKQLEEASGVKQPVIARLERGTTDPQLSTVMKGLASLGKTLVIAPLQSKAQARKSKTA